MPRAGIIRQSSSSPEPERRGEVTSRPETTRDHRVEQRRNYTDAATSRGADGQGIAIGTNTMYNVALGGKPEGDRDDWSERDQQKITVTEHQAANRIRELPVPPEGTNQRAANNAVVQASRKGAEETREWYEDPESPNPFSLL